MLTASHQPKSLPSFTIQTYEQKGENYGVYASLLYKLVLHEGE